MSLRLVHGRAGGEGGGAGALAASALAPEATLSRTARRVHPSGASCIQPGRGVPVLALVLLALAGCGDRGPTDPGEPPPDLFASYVAVGNSITAGFQSEGINRETQRTSYAVLLAERMGTEFGIPELRLPGCPPPLIDGLTRERLGGSGAPLCSFRSIPLPPVVHNVAVPGARVGDVVTADGGPSSPNPLQLLLLGGDTQIEAARRAEPTFVSVWIGNNDVLAAAMSGIAGPERVTPLEEFRAAYREILDELEAAGAVGGILVGVADVTRIPYLSPGVEYWKAALEGRLPAGLEVASSCAPAADGGNGDETLVPFGVGLGDPAAVVDCEAERVLQPDEIDFLLETVHDYNRFLRDEAEARGWAFHDPNPRFRALAEAGAVPSFPLLETPGELFGPLFSLDGVHPGAAGHRIIASELVEAINAWYGTSLLPIETPPVTAAAFRSFQRFAAVRTGAGAVLPRLELVHEPGPEDPGR